MTLNSLLQKPYAGPVILALSLLFLYAGYRFFAFYNTWTDDVYVSAHVINMAPQVDGPLVKLYIRENQPVKKGDKLVEIDPRPYLYEMKQAEANLKLATVVYENQQLEISVAENEVKRIQDQLALSQDHYMRFQKLVVKSEMAQIKLVDVMSQIKQQEASLASAVRKLEMARQNFDVNQVLRAEAIYNRTKYFYEQTTMYAPVDGFVTNFNVRRGQYVSKGQSLFAVVDTRRWWLVARYRETVIRRIRPGRWVRITLDMYPGKVFRGYVRSIGWGINRVQSGPAAPSTLEYMKPTEYWIKIAQRFPVRIYFENWPEHYPLRIGASGTTWVDTRDSSPLHPIPDDIDD